MHVGTRELKNRLSHYLRRVRETGESLYVTDRGEVVAELRPARPAARASKKAEREALLALAARGEISMGTGQFKDFEAIKPKRALSVAGIVVNDRR